MNLSPILIQVYTRKNHFINCVESLSRCKLADKSHLFIVSDAPKTENEKQIVVDIREYCKNIKGFAKVNVLAFENNLGRLNAFEQAMMRIFSEYNTMIFSEDDNVFSINFLEFINEGLEFYKNNSKVLSICGYKHPFQLPQKYPNDVFVSKSISGWGFGIWKEKYLAVNFHPKSLDVSMKQVIQMSYCWQILMLESISENKVHGDALMEYHCLKYNMVNIFPVVSLVQNHGNDGSGAHCSVSPKYTTQEICTENRKFHFINDLTILPNIEKKQADAIDFPFTNKIQRLYLKPILKAKLIIKKVLKIKQI